MKINLDKYYTPVKLANYCYDKVIELIGEEKRNQIIMGIRGRMFGEGMILEKVTFDDWIKHITELSKNS